MAEIVFDHVTKVFQEQIALEDISFQIEKGEFVFVTGKSGAGKSTLLELLIKQQEPTAGNVFGFQKALGVLKRKRFLIIEEDWELCRLRSGCSIT